MSQAVNEKWFMVGSYETAGKVMKEVDEYLATLDKNVSYNVYYRSEDKPMPEVTDENGHDSAHIVVETFSYHSCGESWDYLATQGGSYDGSRIVVTILKEHHVLLDAMEKDVLSAWDWDFREYEEPDGYENLETWVGGKYRADVIDEFERARKEGIFEQMEPLSLEYDEDFTLADAIKWFNGLGGQERAIFLLCLDDGNFEYSVNKMEGEEYNIYNATYNRSREANELHRISGSHQRIGEEIAERENLFWEVPEECRYLIDYFDYDSFGYSRVRDGGDFRYLGYYSKDSEDGTLFWEEGTIEFYGK